MEGKGAFYSEYTMAIVVIHALVIAIMMLVITVGNAHAQAPASCGSSTNVGPGGVDCQIDLNQPGNGSGTNDNGSSVPSAETGNNNSDHNNNNNGNGEGDACTPGTIVDLGMNFPASSSGIQLPGQTLPPNSDVSFTLPDGSIVGFDGLPSNSCITGTVPVDSCTGEIMGATSLPDSGSGDSWSFSTSECPTSTTITIENPCDEFLVSGGGITCVSDLTDSSSYPGSSFSLHAHAPWPGIEIHARPFPITLVDWDTVMRVTGLGSSSGAGYLGYVKKRSDDKETMLNPDRAKSFLQKLF